jgi:hypothetical protein
MQDSSDSTFDAFLKALLNVSQKVDASENSYATASPVPEEDMKCLPTGTRLLVVRLIASLPGNPRGDSRFSAVSVGFRHAPMKVRVVGNSQDG